eukprot:gene9941-20669_t
MFNNYIVVQVGVCLAGLLEYYHLHKSPYGHNDNLKLWDGLQSKGNMHYLYASKEAFQALWKHQHPKECSRAKFIISPAQRKAGFGSEIHVEGNGNSMTHFVKDKIRGTKNATLSRGVLKASVITDVWNGKKEIKDLDLIKLNEDEVELIINGTGNNIISKYKNTKTWIPYNAAAFRRVIPESLKSLLRHVCSPIKE